eukprot:1179330-Prorocentrum_minimum.AAC.2
MLAAFETGGVNKSDFLQELEGMIEQMDEQNGCDDPLGYVCVTPARTSTCGGYVCVTPARTSVRSMDIEGRGGA